MPDESIRILLVEDNEDHAELARRALRATNTKNIVFHLSDGDQTLDYLHRRGQWSSPSSSPRPHLILLDLRLPRVDGLEVLRDIRAADSLRHIPVIVVSSSDAAEDVSAAMAAHANSYVLKPSDFESLAKLIRDLADYWLNWDLGVQFQSETT